MAFEYRGILAEPRKYDPMPVGLSIGSDSPERVEWFKHNAAAELERWRALFEAHAVPFGDQNALLLKLADAHVPGFRMQRAPGRKVTWDVGKRAELRVAIDDFIAHGRQQGKRISVAQACTLFAKREPWKSRLSQGAKSPQLALREHYNKADAVFAIVYRYARLWESLPPHEKTQAKMQTLGRDLAHELEQKRRE